ncbi:MAG: hypothetical protein F6K19_29965 [Cyanothece sp. SIO1E1]|nr:hypothetical protein [Cyanothece sp. SIO1E1]
MASELDRDQVLDITKRFREELGQTASRPFAVQQEVDSWAEHDPFLTEKIYQLILNAQQFIPFNQEKTWIEDLVRSHLIDSGKNPEVAAYFQEIRNSIISNEQSQNLLNLYQRVLQHETVTVDDNPAAQALLESGLVINRQGKLNLKNRIYKSVFNQNWVEATLAKSIQAQSIAEQSKPGNLSKLLSAGALVVFLGFAILYIIWPKPELESADNVVPTTPANAEVTGSEVTGSEATDSVAAISPVNTEFCNGDLPDPENQISQIEAFTNELNGDIPQACKTKLDELLYATALTNATEGRVLVATAKFCQLSETSQNLETAKVWLKRWLNSEDWSQPLKEYLVQNPACPMANSLGDI